MCIRDSPYTVKVKAGMLAHIDLISKIGICLSLIHIYKHIKYGKKYG